jgi:hypothetical protein
MFNEKIIIRIIMADLMKFVQDELVRKDFPVFELVIPSLSTTKLKRVKKLEHSF